MERGLAFIGRVQWWRNVVGSVGSGASGRLPGEIQWIESPKQFKGIRVAPEVRGGFVALGRVVKVSKIREFY